MTSPAREVEVDAAHRGDVAVPHDDAAGPQRRSARARRPGRGRRHGRRSSESRSAPALPAGVADRQRQRRPARQPAELDDRRRDRGGGEHRGGRAVGDRAVAGEVDDAVGVLHDPFEPVLGEHDGDAEVVHEPGDRGQHLLGRGRVERRGRLVEHEHRGDGRSAPSRSRPAAAGRPRARATARRRSSARPSRSSVSSTRLRITSGGRPSCSMRVGELVLDGVGDEAGQRVLADDADEVGQLARRMVARCRDRRRVPRPASVPPVKCGTSPLIAPSSVDLPAPVRPTTRHSSPSSMRRLTSRSTGRVASG